MNLPWIQISIDTQDVSTALEQVEIARGTGAEWIEAGTPLLTFAGIESIAAIAGAVPERTVVADFKALDGVSQYFRRAGELGAGVATVMALANDASIRAAVEAAHANGVKVQADLLNVPHTRMADSVTRLERLGVDFLLLHLGIDQLLADPSSDALTGLDEALRASSLPIGPVVFDAAQGAEAVRRGASYVVIGYPLMTGPHPSEELTRFEEAIRSARHSLPREVPDAGT